jgi:hypothetical protein
MLIPIIDNIRYLNLHVLWLKVEWRDLIFMPCKYFGTSLKRQLFGRYYYFFMILSSVLCPIRPDNSTPSMDHDDGRTCRCFFSLCDRDSSYLVGSHRKKGQNVWNYIISCRSWGRSWGIRPFFSRMPVWEYVGV